MEDLSKQETLKSQPKIPAINRVRSPPSINYIPDPGPEMDLSLNKYKTDFHSFTSITSKNSQNAEDNAEETSQFITENYKTSDLVTNKLKLSPRQK